MKRRNKLFLLNYRKHCVNGHSATTEAVTNSMQCQSLQSHHLDPPKPKHQSSHISHIISSFTVHYLTLTFLVTYFALATAQSHTAQSWISTLQTSNEPRWTTNSVADSTTSTPALIESFSSASSSHAHPSSIVNTTGKFLSAGKKVVIQ